MAIYLTIMVKNITKQVEIDGFRKEEEMITREDYNDISDMTYCKLMDLKIAKKDLERAVKIKGKWVLNEEKTHLISSFYTDNEKERIIRRSKMNFNLTRKEFMTLWKVRRVYQAILKEHYHKIKKEE